MDGPLRMIPANARAVRAALEAAGAEFIAENGVRLRSPRKATISTLAAQINFLAGTIKRRAAKDVCRQHQLHDPEFTGRTEMPSIAARSKRGAKGRECHKTF